MNSPALNTNWQNTAQPDMTRLDGACACHGSCQHVTHAESKSPFSAMVCRNHYPSPSSTRFSASASGSGLFSPIDRRSRRVQRSRHALRNGSRKYALGTTRYQGTMTAKINSERGSHTCSTESFSWGRLPLPFWRDASGTTCSAPAWAQPRAQWSQKQPAATFLPVQSSVQAQVRFAMTWASVSATDLNSSGSAQRGPNTHNRPAETIRSGGLFYVNQRDTVQCRALT